MHRFTACLALLVCTLWAGTAWTQSDPAPSQCLAIAHDLQREQTAPVRYASLAPALPASSVAAEVAITYAGHSTYVIETPAGVRIATDFSGVYGANPLPRVVTMNRAHSTHFTLYPDPGIEFVLPGWNTEGPGPAKHRVVVDDVYIRNVTTDIRGGSAMAADSNSVFIFEVADLCIGHLGHLHHRLTDKHYAQIGRLDIVMVPIDGGLTLSHDGMSEIVRRLQSSIVLPMHRFATPIDRFLARVAGDYAIDFRSEATLTVSVRLLPRRPTIVILAGV